MLHHGRGSNEQDLISLADVLDPHRRLLVVAPRAPLRLPGSPGYHWYLVPRVGHPDHDTFHAARNALAQLHEELWQRTGVDASRTVLGGFSMGTAMSYALALDPGRTAPAGLLAFSGFIPDVEDWHPSLADRGELRAFIAHGRNDPVIPVRLARDARDHLDSADIAVSYNESEIDHHIDPQHIPIAAQWLAATLP